MSSAQGPPQRQHHRSRHSSELFSITEDRSASGVVDPSALFSRWTLPDVVNYVFHLVWICGIPVHSRYVAQILAHMKSAGEPPSAEGEDEKESTTDHRFNRVVQQSVFPLVCHRAVSVNEYVIRHQLRDDCGAMARLVALSRAVPDAIAHQTPSNCEGDEINTQCDTIEIIEVPTDGHVNIDVLTLCSLSSSVRGSLSKSVAWEVETYRTALHYSRQLELCLKKEKDILISSSESDDDMVCSRRAKGYFPVEVVQDSDTDEGDSGSAVMENCSHECIAEKNLDPHASKFTVDDAAALALRTPNGAKYLEKTVKRAVEVIVVSDDDADDKGI